MAKKKKTNKLKRTRFNGRNKPRTTLIKGDIDRLLVEDLKRRAKKGAVVGIALDEIYLRMCAAKDERTGTSMTYTQHVGYHSEGGITSPQFETCYCLALSFYDINSRNNVSAPFDEDTAEEWIRAFFGVHVEKLWVEYMVDKNGHQSRHYRLFVDKKTWLPIEVTDEPIYEFEPEYERGELVTEPAPWERLHPPEEEEEDNEEAKEAPVLN